MSTEALTVDEFCLTHRISRATFYNLLKRQQAPTVMRVGSRVLISKDAAADWRRKMETQSDEPVAA